MNTFLDRWIKAPPPAWAIEFSEGGIAVARPAERRALQMYDLPLEALIAQPSEENFRQPDAVQRILNQLRPGLDARQRESRIPVVAILPDFAAKVSIIPFEEFPKQTAEQLALIRFRLRRGVPFDVDQAALSWQVQSVNNKLEVAAVAVAKPVIDQYELALQAAGLEPGLITISSLAACDLIPSTGTTLAARINGRILTLTVVQGTLLRLYRCLELSTLTIAEIEEALYPTAAWIEDELQAKVDRLLLCGFGSAGDLMAEQWRHTQPSTVDIWKSPLATVTALNAGLVGYLQSLEAA